VPRRVIAAFSLAAAAPFLTAASLDLAIGKRLFERNWVSAPSSTKSNDGLGPLYDATSCAACHTQSPSGPANETSPPPGNVIRLGNAAGSGDPIYGAQLQTRGIAGQVPEADPDIAWTAQGELRTATVTLRDLGYGALAPDTKIALRRAPSLRGAGLLAQISESEILSHADPEDANHDGIAGRAPWVTVNGKRALGRFGWKATQPDVAAQTAIAFSRDIGLSTRLDPQPWGDCTESQPACRAGPHGAEKGEPEVADSLLDLIAGYVAAIPPPLPGSGEGAKLFAEAGCAACHATLRFASGKPVPAYTDLLLHDLGPGLNDGIKEGAAEPGFWRTAPLWDVAGSLKLGGLLHDGRARNVGEAVEWHAGEAAAARARFRALSPSDKAALVGFVSGL
ncbi:MAG TPA: di-heme oxidoredictase family protein, partial [Micropepsaceae bacterium]|nr:di-heme oxidoredictase family protein [Micropepsaceae bacterium]